MTMIRLKFGRNPYTQEFRCGRCGCRFERGGLFVRVECAGKVVDIPVCPDCERAYGLFEGMVDLTDNNPSHRIGIA